MPEAIARSDRDQLAFADHVASAPVLSPEELRRIGDLLFGAPTHAVVAQGNGDSSNVLDAEKPSADKPRAPM